MSVAVKRVHPRSKDRKDPLPGSSVPGNRPRAVTPLVTPLVTTKLPKSGLSASERESLILEHMEASSKFAWTLLKRWRISIPTDEVQSIANTALCEAAVRFDPSYNVSFKTFFFYHLRGLLLRDITRRVKESRRQTTGDEVFRHRDELSEHGKVWPSAFVTMENPEQMLGDHQLRKELRKACESLDPVSREVMRRCFVEGETVSQVARELGYCRCHISRLKTKALRFLREFLDEQSSPLSFGEPVSVSDL